MLLHKQQNDFVRLSVIITYFSYCYTVNAAFFSVTVKVNLNYTAHWCPVAADSRPGRCLKLSV